VTKSKRDLKQSLAAIYRAGRVSAGALLFLNATASLAYAHGGMAGPDELGPPLLTSAALGFVCYWIVILWPKAQRKDPDSSARSRTDSDGGRRPRTFAPGRLSGVTRPSGRKRVASRFKKASNFEGKANDVANDV
jgi:hypothetical protein